MSNETIWKAISSTALVALIASMGYFFIQFSILNNAISVLEIRVNHLEVSVDKHVTSIAHEVAQQRLSNIETLQQQDHQEIHTIEQRLIDLREQLYVVDSKIVALENK